MKPTVTEITIPNFVEQIVLCGGPYNNFSAVESFLKQTQQYEYRFCLGDMGGFGPYPNRTIDLIRDSGMSCIQGNYDYAVGHGEPECGCGYLDPMDRKYAQISFDYTLKHTSEKNREWLRSLPQQLLLNWQDQRILLCHGSPEEMSAFVWESETSDEKLAEWLREFQVHGICGTHSGLPWVREIHDVGFWMNVGVIGRPAHEGRASVYYGVVSFKKTLLQPQLKSLEYDPGPVVQAMRDEKLPEKFCQSLEQGVWTTCYKILPPKELPVQRRG